MVLIEQGVGPLVTDGDFGGGVVGGFYGQVAVGFWVFGLHVNRYLKQSLSSRYFLISLVYLINKLLKLIPVALVKIEP